MLNERVDKTEYPIEAIRETILNALIHRDYSHYTEGMPIQINICADRMEIHIPDLEEEKDESAKDLLEFCKEPRTRKEIAEYLGIGIIFYVMKNYVQPLVDMGKLKLTIPEKTKSRNQKFLFQQKNENVTRQYGATKPWTKVHGCTMFLFFEMLVIFW